MARVCGNVTQNWVITQRSIKRYWAQSGQDEAKAVPREQTPDERKLGNSIYKVTTENKLAYN